jgi:hypothetical protein
MKLIKSKKGIALLAALAVAVVAAVGAYAYWTTSGSGTGSATTGTNSAVSITQTSTVSGLRPGSPAQALDFDINNTASVNQYVTSVVVAMTGVTGPNIDGTHPCTTGDFSLVQPAAINADLTPGVHHYAPSGATLAMLDSGSNQDGCKGATVALSYTISTAP